MRYTRLTTADDVREPVRVDELLSYGRIGQVDRLDELERLIRGARTKVERFAGVILVPGTFLVRADAWSSSFDLPVRPVTAITAFRYYTLGGLSATVDPAYYVVDVATESSRVVLTAGAPTPYDLRALGGVELEVTAGYARPEDIPEDVRQVVLRAAVMAYEHRSDPDVLRVVDDYVEHAAYQVCVGDLV